MIRKAALVASLALFASGLIACRSSGNSGDDDGSVIDTPPGGAVHIQDIQNDAMAPGTAVSLSGVVVTAIDAYGAKTGDIWVEEPGGGEFSGIHVFGAPLSVVSTLAVGDIVSIDGAEKDEFAYQGSNGSGGDTSGRSVTELKPVTGGMLTVTKTGTGTVPAPQAVDAVAIGQKATQAERDAEWEKWEGVLITVSNVSAQNDAKCVGSACNDPTLNNFKIAGGGVVESALAAFPGTAPGSIKRGDCITNITGVVDYFFDYLLLNTTSDFATGTGCPVEATHASCSDGLDNDGNGFVDCADFSCQQADPVCSVQTTIVSIQMGTTTGPVMLTNVFVTARDEIGATSKGIWVADALQAAQYNSVYVFTGSTVDPTFVVGAKVNVQGTVQEFDVGGAGAMGDKLTEIGTSTVTLVAGAPGTPLPATTATAAMLSDIGATGEPWEGVLVKLTTMKVTNNALMNNKVELTDNAGNKVTMDDDAFAYAPTGTPLPANGTCYSSITGIMSVQLTDNIRTLNPRSAADMVVGAGCN